MIRAEAEADSTGPVRDTTVIVVNNKKGGVSKTTTTQTLGAALGQLGRKVLLVDVDPSGGLTEGFGVPLKGFPTLYDVIASASAEADAEAPASEREDDEERIQTLDAVIEGDEEIRLPKNVHLIPASENLVLVDRLPEKDDWFSFQDMLLQPIEELRGTYDYIIVDTPPNVNKWAPAATKAADFAILTCIPEHYAIKALAKAMSDIKVARRRGNPNLQLLGIVVNNIPEPRTRLARHLLKHVREDCLDRDGNTFKFETEISRTVTLQEAQSLAQTVFEYDPEHKVCQEYLALAREVEERVKRHRNPLLAEGGGGANRLTEHFEQGEAAREVQNG